MKNLLSQEEKAFFLRLKGDASNKVRIVPIAILAVILFGLIIDAFCGFYLLRMASSLIWGSGG